MSIWKFMVHILLKPRLENFEHYLTRMWDECNCAVVWAFFGITFLWYWNENWPFPVLWPLLSFQICWHIEFSTFKASSFRIWNSSTGIPSPPLALFTVILSKAHLTSHSKMSGSRWVITPSWLSGSWRSFLYSFSPYSCHLFLISSASVRSIQFLSFIEPIFAWNVPLVSLIFLKRSLVFPILLFSSIIWIDCWGRLSFLFCYSLEFCIQMPISFLFSFAFHFSFYTAIVRSPQTAILLFCLSFPWGWSWSLSPVQCHKPPSIVHQALCLLDLVP